MQKEGAMRRAAILLVPGVFVLVALGSLTALTTMGGRDASEADKLYLEAPAGDRYTRIDPDGETVLPNGRLLTPAGRQIPTAPHPFGLALSADGKVLVTVNGGIVPFSLTVIRDPESDAPQVLQIPARTETDKRRLPSAFLGAAIDTERGLLYASGGDHGVVAVFSLATGARIVAIDLSTAEERDSFTTDLALSKDGRWLYALDLAHFRLVTIDTTRREAVGAVRVGRNPMALRLSRDGRRAYVANMGTFEYALVEGAHGPDAPRREPSNHDPRGLPFPPFGYPSREAREGTTVDGRKVPGLGDPNAPEACSVFVVDVERPDSPKVVAQMKTGRSVGEALGGSSPAGLAVSDDTLYVSNATNDTVEAWDLQGERRRWTSLLAPTPALRELRGVLPFGMALSPDARRLYVAESGLNALAVLDATTGAVLGHVPTGWYPAGVAVSPSGAFVYVSNAKGYGSGPNAGPGFTPMPWPSPYPGPDPDVHYIGRLMKGTVSLLPTPTAAALSDATKRVLANNGFVPVPPKRPADHPVPALPGTPSAKIRHVVFITKENRTFDEVLGDLPGANGDPALARFGEKRRVGPYDGITVMPNHRALAGRFAVGDNFYVDSDVSADGHRWLVGAYTNHWVETMTTGAYGGGVKFERDAGPGRLALFESGSSVTPEEYGENGSMWEHLERHHVRFYNYGEGTEFAGASEVAGLEPTGERVPVNIPMPEPLFRNTSRVYPGFNTHIPDQYRADIFLREFEERWASGKEPLPAFIYLYLPNDHGDQPRHDKGYPWLESYMADNDLALGRVIEALSASRFWKETAVFVTEDDAQSGRDHVDAHRSLCFVLSPYAKRGYVSHRHLSIASITKTIYRLLGLPHLHLYDAAASDLADLFTPDPDFTPFRALPVDARIFDPAKVRDPDDPEYRHARREPGVALDTMDEAVRQLGGGSGDDDDGR
jgi:YVTN family beta-propeller protein